MIIGYYGNVRQGKTYNAVLELLKLYLDGYTIYSNTHLSIPYKELTIEYLQDIALKDLDVEDNAVFFVDEISVWLDSRTSLSKRNRIITTVLQQSGKLGINTDYGLIFLFTAQYPDMVDKRLRHFTDKGVSCRKFTATSDIYNKGIKLLSKGDKYFDLEINIFKGHDSYSYHRITLGNKFLYNMYNTRKKIRFVPDKISGQEIVIV
jgi:hypothetical protein